MTGQAPFGLVAIGASAGGIEAFHQFFAKMPADSGLAFVVVLHLSAGRKSMLPGILARWTKMPVEEAHDGVAVEPDRVLVIPGGVNAELRDGHLFLRPMPVEPPISITSIDAFFDSVASSLGEEAIGIILSGTGHDGSLGLKAIKARGGLTLAQGGDGSGPEYPGMPDSAVATGAVDLHVRVEEMPDRILAARNVRLATSRDGLPAQDEDKIRFAICDILRSRLGHDFSQYKQQTFLRRVQRRMQVTRLTRYQDYIQLLESNREQTVLLFRDLLIGVTSFFRDTATFAALENDIIPRLFVGKDATSVLRVWVPGCATGEEAYSLAILMREHMDTLTMCPKVQIFASDIDEVAIGTARAGRYPATLLEGMSPARLSRFFAEASNGFSIRQEVRELCTFSAHSLIRDPPFSRIDLISCRNLLIYMDNDLQDRVIPIFHYALVPNGMLVLGSSETIPRHDRLFETLDRSQRIFLRRDGPSDVPKIHFATSRVPPSSGLPMANRSESRSNQARAVAFANRRVLERFASPFVVINASFEVVHFSSHIGRFLEPAAGVPTANLFEMARRGWALELRAALRRCIELGRPIEHIRAVADIDGKQASPVRLMVEPLPSPGSDPLYMIAFVEGGAPQGGEDAAPAAGPVPEANVAIADLERENRDLREHLRSVIEEHATAIEELRSSNEELQSVNEELQSTNEELETSREEIQSINEELNTVNVQLLTKMEQLDRNNSDLRNLFESTKVATVFLDPYFTIRSFTPEIASIYNLIPSDVGRGLTDIVSRLSYTTLREDVQAVLKTLQPLEKRVESLDRSAHFLMRILPYRAPDSTVDGSLITFVDVTSIVRAEQHQRLLVDELNHRVKNMLTVVISLATNTLRQSPTLDVFRDVFLGRIHALNAAYALLSRDAWSAIPLREILMEELRPFLSGDRANVTLNGPTAPMEPRAALAMGMAIHELTTNAIKYDALSFPEGQVEIGWAVEDHEDHAVLTLTWNERNGPPVPSPATRGFGTTLVERAFAQDVGGQAKIAFNPDGVVAVLRAPLPDRDQESRPDVLRHAASPETRADC